MKPNLVELRKMAAHSREHGVYMPHWFLSGPSEHVCGTAGCLVGNYIVYEKLDHCRDGDDINRAAILDKLQLSSNQFDWLFTESYPLRGKELCNYRDLCCVGTEEALQRLERFIAYHEKQEAMAQRLVHTRQIKNQNNVLELAAAS